MSVYMSVYLCSLIKYLCIVNFWFQFWHLLWSLHCGENLDKTWHRHDTIAIIPTCNVRDTIERRNKRTVNKNKENEWYMRLQPEVGGAGWWLSTPRPCTKAKRLCSWSSCRMDEAGIEPESTHHWVLDCFLGRFLGWMLSCFWFFFCTCAVQN